MTLIDVLKNTANKFGSQPAVFFENESCTYDDLDTKSSTLSSFLIGLGINKGDRIAIFSPNCIEYLFCYFGILKAGAIVVPINSMLKGKEIEHVVNDCNPRILIAHHSLLEVILPIKNQLSETFEKFIVMDGNEKEYGDEFIYLKKTMAEGTRDIAGPEVRGDDDAMILYTSGTTGSPKGCIMRHQGLVRSAEFGAEATGHNSSDKVLCCTPLFHIYGFSISVLCSILSGATIVLMERFDAKKAIEAIKKYKVTIFVGVPTILTYLLNETGINSADFASLRINVSSSASLPVEVLTNYEQRFDTIIQEVYGITESSGEATFNPIEKRKPGSIGIPHPGLELKITDKKGEIVKTGEVGEITIRGEIIMRGYWKKESETRKVLTDDGWYSTGDLGRKDEDGYLYIVGRSKEMIITGGFNIYPRELEEVLYKHPDIHEAAVIGIPDKTKGELACAYVVLHEGKKMEEEALRLFLKEQLANYKVPRLFRFVDSLPKTGTGKISKKMLSDQQNLT